jgi:hypothetical protein
MGIMAGSVTKTNKTLRSAPTGIKMLPQGSGYCDLWQSAFKVTMSLEKLFQRFPGITNSIGVTILPLSWHIRRNSGIGCDHRIPITEVPSFQFLDRDPIHNLPAGGRLTARSQSYLSGDLLHTAF